MRCLFFLRALCVAEREGKRKEIADTRGALGCSAEATSGPIRGSLAASECVSIPSASPSPASAFPASCPEAAPSPGSTAQGGRRPGRLTHPPWGAPLASGAGAASLVLLCREETSFSPDGGEACPGEEDSVPAGMTPTQPQLCLTRKGDVHVLTASVHASVSAR